MALFLVSIETGERRQWTYPQGGPDAGDWGASDSPDGGAVAFCRFASSSAGEVYVIQLGKDLAPRGGPQRLTAIGGFFFARTAWTPDGKAILASAWLPLAGLFRIPAKGRGAPQRLDFAGENVTDPAVSGAAHRLVYSDFTMDRNIWAISTVGSEAARAKPLLASTRFDYNPQFSPDGKKIAFSSDRGGSAEIWVADANGGNAIALTSFNGPNTGTPRWSPDGRWIAFDAIAGGTRDIFVIDARGGKPRALTADRTNERVPSWSRDGRSIYFSSDREGSDQIWKMPAEGGEPLQITRNGGYVAFESPDGKFLYYTRSVRAGPLLRLPLAGGEETQVVGSVFMRAFAVTERGIYFIGARDKQGAPWLRMLETATGRTREIAPINRPPGLGLTVSPDGRTVLYTQEDQAGSDLMLVENFR